eukprot:600487-Rhodomonas_salina.2
MEPTKEGWEWAPEGWDVGPYEYALDFPNSRKMLFLKVTCPLSRTCTHTHTQCAAAGVSRGRSAVLQEVV